MPRGSVSLYQDVASQLVKDIEDGVYVIGGLLPTEHELSAIFSVSRQTIRASLTQLQDQGYISRKKAVGSRVESANPAGGYHQVYDSIEDLVRTAADAEVRVTHAVRHVTLDRGSARRLEAPIGSAWIKISATRVRPGQGYKVVSWQDVFLDPEFEKLLPIAEAHPDKLISTLLEREFRIPIAEIRQTISVTSLSDIAARALKVKRSSAALLLLRHFRDRGGRTLVISETNYPGDSVRIASRIVRASPDPS